MISAPVPGFAAAAGVASAGPVSRFSLDNVAGRNSAAVPGVRFGAPAAAEVLASPFCAAFASAEDVAVSARGPAVVPPREADADFDRVPAAFLDREGAAVLLGREPDSDDVDRAPAPDEANGAAPPPSVTGGSTFDPAASALAWSWSSAAALADRGWVAARGWLIVAADCRLAERLGAGSVPCPAELSAGIPFSEVTAP